jgi:hypothetical protein
LVPHSTRCGVDTLRRYRFRTYRILPRAIGLPLEEWETNRLFRRLIAAETDWEKRRSLEHEHAWELSQLAEQRAIYIADRIYAKAHKLYIETPPLTAKDDDPNWEHGTYHDRWILTRRAVADLRAKIRAEKKATWEPWLLWAGAIGGWVAATAAFFK